MNYEFLEYHQLEHPANFLVHRKRHPNNIQLVLWVVEEVWSTVTSTESVKKGKGKASCLPSLPLIELLEIVFLLTPIPKSHHIPL